MRALPSLLLIILVFSVQTAGGGEAGGPMIVEHGPRDLKKVALTFDACPTSREDEFDERIIEVLWAEKASATLFMSGRWVEKNADVARFLAGQPQFEIGNHAFWHPHMLEKDDERILRELRRTQDIIRKVTGKRPKYFRPPFGEVDDRLAELASKAGLVTVQYDIASGDPDPALPAERIARAVVANAKSGSIVVFHMNENGLRTAEALPGVIRGLREKGFELVTVGEMLQGQPPSRHRGAETQRTAVKEERRTGMKRSTSSHTATAVSPHASQMPESGITTEITNTAGIQPVQR